MMGRSMPKPSMGPGDLEAKQAEHLRCFSLLLLLLFDGSPRHPCDDEVLTNTADHGVRMDHQPADGYEYDPEQQGDHRHPR